MPLYQQLRKSLQARAYRMGDMPIDFLFSQALPVPGMQELRHYYESDLFRWRELLLAKLAEAPPRPKTERAIIRRVMNDWAVQERLEQSNGNRRERLLDIDDVAWCVKTAFRDLRAQRDGWGTCFTDGGSVGSAYKYRAATTTLGVVFYPDGLLGVGIAEGPAHASSPGRTWPILQPWDSSLGRPRGGWQSKLWRWAGNPTVVIWGPPTFDRRPKYQRRR